MRICMCMFASCPIYAARLEKVLQKSMLHFFPLIASKWAKRNEIFIRIEIELGANQKKIRYAQNIRSEKCKAEGLRSDGCLSVAVTLPWIKLDADLKQSNQKRSIWQYKLEVYEVRYLTFYSKFSFLSDWVFLRMFYFSRFNA